MVSFPGFILGKPNYLQAFLPSIIHPPLIHFAITINEVGR